MAIASRHAGLVTRMRHAHHGEDAQGMLEMALVLPILLLLICGIIDFGFIFTSKVAVANAARNGARFATTHPLAWSNASSAPLNTIEGIIQSTGGTASIPNDDSHIMITYLNADGTTCGHYSAASGSFTPSGQQGVCAKPGNQIQVQVTYQYNLITPLARQLGGGSVSFGSTATMLEEQ